MTITKIEQQKRNPNRFSVFLDGQFAFGIDGVDLLFYKLREGLCLSDKDYERIVNELLVVKARDAALSFISYRMRSEKEVYIKLTQGDYGEETIFRVIQLLKRNGLIDDFAFAKAFIADKMRLGGFGQVRIRHELFQKGISRETVDKAYEALEEEWEEDEDGLSLLEQELEKAILLLEKKFHSNNLKEQKELIRAQNFLLRKGYSYAIISKAIKNYCLYES